MGVGASPDHKSSNRIELCQLGQDLFDFQLFNMSPPQTHQSTHTPTKPYTHP